MRCHKLFFEVPGFVPTTPGKPFCVLSSSTTVFGSSVDGRPVPEIIEPWHLIV